MIVPFSIFRRILPAAVLTTALLSVAACATDKVPTPDEIKQDNADNRARQLVRVGDASRAGVGPFLLSARPGHAPRLGRALSA